MGGGGEGGQQERRGREREGVTSILFFSSAVTCSLDQKSSKVVPIAVGAALAGLVVVVLIAYLIGRFRSRKQNSYEALS